MAVAKCVLPLVKAPTGDWRHARPTDEHHVLCRIAELQRGEPPDQVFINLGRGKVKPGQVPVQGELGRLHLVTHRCHGPVGVLGLLAKCSINHFEDAIPGSPWAVKSSQAPTMPRRRSSLSSVMTSLRMADLHGVADQVHHAAQAVVPTGVGQRRLLELQGGFHRLRRWRGVESG